MKSEKSKNALLATKDSRPLHLKNNNKVKDREAEEEKIFSDYGLTWTIIEG